MAKKSLYNLSNRNERKNLRIENKRISEINQKLFQQNQELYNYYQSYQQFMEELLPAIEALEGVIKGNKAPIVEAAQQVIKIKTEWQAEESA